MNKITKMMLVLTTALLMLAGCSGKTFWQLTINNTGSYSIVSVSKGLNDWGWQEAEADGNSGAQFSTSKDGEYDIVVEDADGNQYTLTVIINDKNAEVKSEDEISAEMKKK